MSEVLHNVLTSTVIYSDEELDFLRALQKYKTDNRRPCPTIREILAVARSLGYRKVTAAGPLPVFKVGVNQNSNT